MSGVVDEYFTSYENLEVHELMLQDRPRQEAYYHAITRNASLFKDKIVLDVGAGTGILSAFCARAGARVVYAVEASNVAKIALQLIQDNSLTSKVKVINSKIEDFQLPSDNNKVDIIVSEWMGFYLLHEGMLESVLYARDKFLAPDGIMFPNEATISIAPCSIPTHFDYWHNVDGVDMKTFGTFLREQKSTRPEIMWLDPENLLHEGVVLHWMNLQDVTLDEVKVIDFKEVMSTQKAGKHQGFCIWFDCRFPSVNDENVVVLSTSPKAPRTHWKQSIVILPEEACEELDANSPIAFNISIKANPNDTRKYNIEVDLLDPDNEEHPIPCDCNLTKCILIKAHLARFEE